MSARIWYLGSPYSHENPAVMERRYAQTCQAAARLFERSVLVYSPIAHTHAVNLIGRMDAATFEHWRAFDLGMIDRLSGLLVLTLPGWDVSHGLTAEIVHAQTTGKSVMWVIPTTDADGMVVDVDIHAGPRPAEAQAALT